MLSILLPCIIILLVIFVRRRLDYFSSRGIPYESPSWKSFLNIFSPSNLIDYPHQLYNRMKDGDNPVIGYFDQFMTPNLLVVDPSVAQKVFIKDFSHFHDHGPSFNTERDPLAQNLFNIGGDKWRTLRMKLLPTFTTGKLKGMIPAMESCASSVVKEMKQDTNFKQDVNLTELFKKFTVGVIASCAFGIEPESVKDPSCEYQRILRQLMTPTWFQQIKFFFVFTFPKFADFLSLKVFPQEVDNFYINLTRETMEMREKSGVKRNDFIQLLMELKEKGSVQIDHRDLEDDEKVLMKQQQLAESETTSKLEMTQELLAAQVSIFIIAGFENSAHVAALTTYLLSKHNDVQQRVREEVRAAKSKHGGINIESIKEMKLLGASIDEALRMHPPLQMLFRACTKDYPLNNGSKIEKGSMVFVPAKSLQNDSKYWRNPEEFNPDRFLTDSITPGTYMPFGDGPRICIAQRLALLMSKIILAEVLDNYETSHSNKTQEPLRPISVVSPQIKGGLWANLQRLNQ